MLALFAKHFHFQVAVGFDPILVDFDREAHEIEPQAASSLGKIPPVNGWCPRNGWPTATPLRRSAPWRLRTPRIAAETVASFLATLG